MTERELTEYLDQLGVLRERLAKRTKAVNAEIAKLEDERTKLSGELLLKIAKLEDKIKSAATAIGHTVQGSTLQAVWYKPRVTWSNDKLDALTAVYPALETARTVAENGTFQIRSV